MNRVALLLVLGAVSLPSLAQVARPSVYIEPQNGFETYVAAAIAKKQVPVDVVTDPAKATFALKAAPCLLIAPGLRTRETSPSS